MNRSLLPTLAAVALAASACHSSNECVGGGNVTFFWRFVGAPVAGQQRAAGDFTALNSGCGDAGIDGIQVTVDGFTDPVVSCADANGFPSITYAGFYPGTHTWTIDAIRSGQIAFTASGAVGVPGCGSVRQDAVLAAVSPSPMVVYYDVNNQPPTGCFYTVPIANVPFELRNLANQIVDTSCQSYDAQSVCSQESVNACDPQSLGFVTRALVTAPYTMNYLELWDAAGRPVATACNQPVVHDGFPAYVNLTPSTAFCPTTPATPLAPAGAAAP